MNLLANIHSYKKKYIIFSGLLIFSLFLHIFGCFYLFDFQNDEGVWLIDAKNKILFNKFSLEGLYATALTPLNTFLHLFVFKLFHPSIWISRYISIGFALATLAIFFLFLYRNLGPKIASLASLIVLSDGVYNRISTFALLEPKVHFFEILMLVCAFSKNDWMRKLSFLSFALALGFKPNIIWFILPLSFALSGYPGESPSSPPGFLKKFLSNILLLALAAALIAGSFFYIAYRFDPLNFVGWTRWTYAWRLHQASVGIKSFQLLSTFQYLFLRAPITYFCFFLATLSMIVEKRKSQLNKFLLIWIFAETAFYSLQKAVPERYLINLIFPLSIFAAQFLSKISIIKFGSAAFRSRLIFTMMTLIVLTQIFGSFYFFLIQKPERPAIATSRWLKGQYGTYQRVLAPASVAIEFPGKSLTSSFFLRIEALLLRDKIQYPLLCIVQKENAVHYFEDDILLKDYGKFIKRIGYFWIYEIRK